MQRIYEMKRPVSILSHASCVGRAEHEGPLGDLFDFHDERETFGERTWERAESELSHATLALALGKAGLSHRDIDLIFSGDLQNQCVASYYAHVEEEIPFLGLYGACSTCTEGLFLASLALSAAESGVACVVTTSHNSAAERQYRTPIEYGGQRTPTSQWTTTAGGAFVLTCDGETRDTPSIIRGMAGICLDSGVSDAANMGAGMAPAAAASVHAYLEKTNTTPLDYDAIVTGDLGDEGTELLKILLAEKNTDLGDRHFDCGKMIYDRRRKDSHSGGSGCGCSAAVLSAYFLPKLTRGEMRRILFLSTGALMSPTSLMQGGTILGVAPAVEIVSGMEFAR